MGKMVIKNLLGKKDKEQSDNKDEEVQKLREKFNTIVNSDQKDTGQAQPAVNQSAQPIANQPAYEYVDSHKAEDNERITNLIMQQIKELIEIDNNLNAKNKELETKIGENISTLAETKKVVDQFDSRLEMIEKNMEKFMGLYEVVTNRFNPFVSEEAPEQGDKAQTENSTVTSAPPQSNPAEIDKEVHDIIEHSDIKTLDKEQETIVEDELKSVVTLVGAEEADKVKEDLSQHISETVAQEVKSSVEHHIELSNEQLKGAIRDMLLESVSHLKETMKTETPATTETTTTETEKPSPHTEELHPDFHFYLPDGTPIKSVQGLTDALKTMDDATFTTHVNDTKNDFAEWLRVVVKKDEIADMIAQQKTREEILKILESL